MYVGQAKDVAGRDYMHSRGRLPFDRFMKKKGRESFLLTVEDSVDDFPGGAAANALENIVMDRLRTYFPESGYGFNFYRAGRFGNMTADLIAARVDAQRWYRPTPEHKAKISATERGKVHSAESRAKMRASHRGKKRPPFSDEWRENLRISHLGVKHTAIRCANIKAATLAHFAAKRLLKQGQHDVTA